MKTERHFIVTRISASGICDRKINPPAFEEIARQMLKSRRQFADGQLSVQPILFVKDGKYPHGNWSFSGSNGFTTVSHGDAYYQLSVQSNSYTQSNLTDGIYAALAILHHFKEEDLMLIPIEAKDIPKNRLIKTSEAAEILKRSLPSTYKLYDCQSIFDIKWSRGYDFDQDLWALVASIALDEQILYASLFLRSSLDEFIFIGDDITTVIDESEEKPKHVYEAVRLENAIHNCYKVVEAICGGPLPKERKKISNRLREAGIDPDERGGYTVSGKFDVETVVDKIGKLRAARNDRAAHGRIHKDRKSTYYELMDYQALACHLLSQFIEFRYPHIH